MHGVRTSGRSALTLIELLVVMGIIAILIALLLSVMAGVRASAMKVACANNLRQIGHGLVVYDQEYGRLPGSEAHKTLSDLPSFRDALSRLRAGRVETFVCPVSQVEPSSYDLNLDYAGRPMSTGRGDVVLASERSVSSCLGCHDSAGTGHNVHGSSFPFPLLRRPRGSDRRQKSRRGGSAPHEVIRPEVRRLPTYSAYPRVLRACDCSSRNAGCEAYGMIGAGDCTDAPDDRHPARS